MIEVWVGRGTNGQKITVMLEECGLPYRLHFVDLANGEHRTPEFLARNPAGKVPVLYDPDGPGGAPITLAQTMAIVLYLAEKTGTLLPRDAAVRADAYRWMALVSSDISAAFSALFMLQFVVKTEDKEVRAYFETQAARNLVVLEQQLERRPYLCGDEITMADMLAVPVAVSSVRFLPGGLDPYPAMQRWRDVLLQRPAVVRGLDATAFD